MKAFSNKCDDILLALTNEPIINWDRFSALTGMKRNDAILQFLWMNRHFIECTEDEIILTEKGRDFIGQTSFAEQIRK